MGKLHRIVISAVQLLGSSIAEDTSAVGKKGNSAATSGNTEFDMNTEIGLLQKMPGYSKLQTRMFVGLMDAEPDDSEDNIRSMYFKAGSDISGDFEGAASSRLILKSTGAMRKSEASDLAHGRRKVGNNALPETLSREVVKDVSQLILEKNAHRIKQIVVDKSPIKNKAMKSTW